MDYFVHESSVVEPGARIGKGTKIWHFCHVMGSACIGENCSLGQNVYVGDNVILGRNVRVQNNVSIYPGVVLEDDVFLGPSMVFTNVTNPRSGVSRKAEFKPTLVGRGTSIGANATILCGLILGKYGFVGAGAVLTRNLPDFAVAYGNPARLHGWMCMCGAKLQFAAAVETEQAVCAVCGREYSKRGDLVANLEAHERSAD